MSKAVVLAIGGSDSGGGAGIQADLKTFERHGVFGTSVVTAVTAQNTLGVQYAEELNAELIEKQLESLFSDFEIEFVKTGMIPSAASLRTISRCLSKVDLQFLVVDPVMKSSSGHQLMETETLDELKSSLIPLADLVTPNLSEASTLASMKITGQEGMMIAAEKIWSLGCRNVLVKGGHLEGEDAVDILFDGKKFLAFSSPKICNRDVHGTGCCLASSIAAKLALGLELEDAIEEAKSYLTRAIEDSISLGKGSTLLSF